MTETELREDARKFFDEFVDAFQSFEGMRIAERYLAPYLAFHAPGSVQVFLSSEDIDEYFQRVVNEYFERGCRSCTYDAMDVFPLGHESALATVTWQLRSDELAVLETWRESYNFCRADGRFKVFTSTDHAT